MKFTGNNLLRVAQGLEDSLEVIHNQIATCPDFTDQIYIDMVEELEAEREQVEKLLARVQTAIMKEEQKL